LATIVNDAGAAPGWVLTFLFIPLRRMAASREPHETVADEEDGIVTDGTD
jgi:hypothetical protein